MIRRDIDYVFGPHAPSEVNFNNGAEVSVMQQLRDDLWLTGKDQLTDQQRWNVGEVLAYLDNVLQTAQYVRRVQR